MLSTPQPDFSVNGSTLDYLIWGEKKQYLRKIPNKIQVS